MGMYLLAVVISGSVLLAAGATGHNLAADQSEELGWDAKAAANYLDGRAEAWTTWPNAARVRGLFCLSFPPPLPYAIARPALRGPLGEREPSAAEGKILGNLLTRARD